VFLGSGQLLVRGATASQLTTDTDPLDATRLVVNLGVDGGESDITDAVRGGSLGGLLEFAEDGLGAARNQLGRIATAFATAVNEQHERGMDYDGDLGGAFFGIADPAVILSTQNTGTASATLAIADVDQLGIDEYQLRFDGANYTILNDTTGASVPFTGTGTAGDPFVFEGLEVAVSGTPAAGDQFSLQPVRNAAASLSLLVQSGRDVAAAFPVTTGTGGSNTGSGVISVSEITDPTDPNLLATTTIQFTDPNTYQVNGAGSFAYTPGAPISVNGVEIEIDGAPQTGDQFTIESNIGGIGDNRNMLALGLVPSEGRLDEGRETLNDAVATLVSQAGISGREAARGLAAQETLLEQAEARVLEVSGVNLDEEAANLIQFQQTYQAAAQMIAVADSLFATILNAVAR
ncbi:MAG: flagellar basal body rod C-terminal domain-containing protein, partial [Pseudomonadota bacterium]